MHLLFNWYNIVKIIWGFLVNTVVEPVAEHKICMTAPNEMRGLRWVVVGEIVLWDGDVQPFFLVAEILAAEGEAVILGVSRDKELPVGAVRDNMYARFG